MYGGVPNERFGEVVQGWSAPARLGQGLSYLNPYYAIFGMIAYKIQRTVKKSVLKNRSRDSTSKPTVRRVCGHEW